MFRNVLTCLLLSGCAGLLDLGGLDFEASDEPGGAGGADLGFYTGGALPSGGREQTGGSEQRGGSGQAAATGSGGRPRPAVSYGGRAATGANDSAGMAGEPRDMAVEPDPVDAPPSAGASGAGGSDAEAGAGGFPEHPEAGSPSTGGSPDSTGGSPPTGGSSGGSPPTGGLPSIEKPVYGSFDPPSCAPALECAGDDCCASLLVQGDSYPLGRGSEQCADCTDGCPKSSGDRCWWDEMPEHTAQIDSFYLDKFEVTVGRFRRFVADYERWHTLNGLPAVADGAGKHSPGWPEGDSLPDTEDELRELLTCKDDPGWDSWTQAPGDLENFPMNCVDWWLSFAFCIWDGGRLPTEAEWELAAAGGKQNRVYPWGNEEPTDEHANFWWGWDRLDDALVRTNVGAFPRGNGRYGHSDLGGSLFEWVFDTWSEQGTLPDPCVNCVNESGFGRVIRGGAWTVETWFMRATARVAPQEGGALFNDNLGFRCARDVPESE